MKINAAETNWKLLIEEENKRVVSICLSRLLIAPTGGFAVSKGKENTMNLIG